MDDDDRQGSSRPVLRLGADHLRLILEHVRSEYPNEACGLLGGRDGLVQRVYPLVNVRPSSSQYEAEPAGLGGGAARYREPRLGAGAVGHIPFPPQRAGLSVANRRGAGLLPRLGIPYRFAAAVPPTRLARLPHSGWTGVRGVAGYRAGIKLRANGGLRATLRGPGSLEEQESR